MVRMTMNDKGYGIEKNDKELYGIIRVEKIDKEQLDNLRRRTSRRTDNRLPVGLPPAPISCGKTTIATHLKINLKMTKVS